MMIHLKNFFFPSTEKANTEREDIKHTGGHHHFSKHYEEFSGGKFVMTSEQCKQRLLELARSPGNNACADCGCTDPAPHFLALNLGLFVCIKCSGFHRGMGTRFSIIKSIMLDTIDETKVKKMEEHGNERGKIIWQNNVPDCWPIVSENSFDDVIEQWIRAKYERQEFLDGASEEKRPYSTGSKYGWLMKKRKQDLKWNNRFFVLSAQQGYLCCYIRQGDGDPKHRIHVSNVNIMLISSECTEKRHSMRIAFPFSQSGYRKSRHLYVHAESSFEIVDWYLAIRAARLKFLSQYLYGVERPVVHYLLSREFIKCGFLYKTGSKKGDGWRKRYICVDIHRFLYFEKPLDSEPIGEISIEKSGMDCFVLEGVDGEHPSPPTHHIFMVKAQQDSRKGRNPTFNFCADSREELSAWIMAFRKGMETLHWLEPIKETDRRFSLLSNISSRCPSVSV